MSPAIEHLNRMKHADMSQGQMWIRQSLLSLNLSSQLQILTANKQHLHQHYEGKNLILKLKWNRTKVYCISVKSLISQEYWHTIMPCCIGWEFNTLYYSMDIPINILSPTYTGPVLVHYKPWACTGQWFRLDDMFIGIDWLTSNTMFFTTLI